MNEAGTARDNRISTPWGHADSFADAVVMYAMHNEICPLAVAQTARDQFETISEELRKSAAPEMAEALAEVVKWDTDSLIDAEWPVVMAQVKAALRKARGEV